MNERVGLAGLGKMGQAIASRISAHGYGVTAWTRSGIPSDIAARTGVTPVANLAELASASDIILLSVSDDVAVTTVLQELVRSDLQGKLIAESSTIKPETLLKLRPAIEASGASVIDAPVAGGPGVAENGLLSVFAGGDARDFARYTPVARTFARKLHHVGALGDAYAMKAVHNLVPAGLLLVLSEAAQLGKRSGFSLSQIMDVVVTGPVSSPFLQSRLPMIVGESNSVDFSIRQALDDLLAFQSVAISRGVEMPLLNAILEQVRTAIDDGDGDSDIVTLITRSYDVLNYDRGRSNT